MTGVQTCALPICSNTLNHINLEYYDKVYSKFINLDADTSTTDILEKMFYVMNTDNRPNRTKCRSMSVSDIVELIEDGTSKYYYCDNIGFKEFTPRNDT